MTPHRSLSAFGFALLMGAIGTVSFIAGVGFSLLGAWPVLGFFGIDVALVWLAFRLNYRSGRLRETVEIEDGTVRLTHQDELGRRRTVELATSWAEVRLRQGANGRTAVALASHGREHSFAEFLTDDERRDVAAVLRVALLEARGGPRI